MKYVLVYETPDGVTEQARQLFPAHQARWKRYQDDGSLLLIGPFTDGQGAMGVFTTEAAAREFAAGDPFVLQGVVGTWHVREWREVLLEPAG